MSEAGTEIKKRAGRKAVSIDRSEFPPTRGADRAEPTTSRRRDPTERVLDTTLQISLFVKLKLTKCARPGNRAGFFHVRGTERSEQMQFQKGQSGNPAGRPPGARNKATMMAESLLQGEAEALTRAAIERAMAGDTAALRMCLDRLAPPSKHRTIAFDLPPLASARDAAAALAAITAAVGAGELTPAEGGELFKLVDGFARMLEARILEQRVARLERDVGASVPKDNQSNRSHQNQNNQISQSDQGARSTPSALDDSSPYNFGDAP
jgi:Family of unknown function (DUF5681)